MGDIRISPALTKLAGAIDRFAGRWSVSPPLPLLVDELRRDAMIESVASALRLDDGSRIGDSDIERVINGDVVAPISGYAEALALTARGELRLSESTIRTLHGALMRVPAPSTYASREGIPGYMETLVRETALELAADGHPLLPIGTFIPRLVMIAPFKVANPRVAWITARLLLVRAGYDFVPCIALERAFEEMASPPLPDPYLAAMHGEEPDLTPYVEWFVERLHAEVLRLDAKRAAIQRMKTNPIDEQVLAFTREAGRLTMGAAVALTNANRNTLKLHLRSLLARGLIEKHGRGRGAWYGLARA